MLKEAKASDVIYQMDPECVEICKCLNNMSGIRTVTSCSGNGVKRFMIVFRCCDFVSLGILARAVDKRYSDLNIGWSIEISSADVPDPYPIWYKLVSNRPYLFSKNEKKDLDEDLSHIIENIEYWSQDMFKNYFEGNEEVRS